MSLRTGRLEPTFCLTFLLTFFLAYLPAFFLALSDIFSDIFPDIFSDISINISSDISSDILFWHIFWHFFGHIFWHSFRQSFLIYLLTFFQAILSDMSSDTLFCHIFWHFFGHSFLTYFWHFFWHFLWHSFRTYLLTSFLTYLPTFFLAYLLTYFLTFFSDIFSDLFLWHSFLTYFLTYLLTFLSDISFDCLSDISSHILSRVSSDIPSDILSGIFWHSFLTYFLTFLSWHFFLDISSGILSGILSDISSGILSDISFDILSGIFSDILFDISSFFFSGGWVPALPTPLGCSPVEVRRCPLRSGAPRWGPALPTAIWSSLLRSGAAHCDLELPVEIRRCPFNVKLVKMTAKKNEEEKEEKEAEEEEEKKTALVKSNNPEPDRWETTIPTILHHFPRSWCETRLESFTHSESLSILDATRRHQTAGMASQEDLMARKLGLSFSVSMVSWRWREIGWFQSAKPRIKNEFHGLCWNWWEKPASKMKSQLPKPIFSAETLRCDGPLWDNLFGLLCFSVLTCQVLVTQGFDGTWGFNNSAKLPSFPHLWSVWFIRKHKLLVTLKIPWAKMFLEPNRRMKQRSWNQPNMFTPWGFYLPGLH